jgi:Ca2+-binding RTX toxin-like protein
LGDNGFVQWDNTGLITQFVSTEPDLGGNDQIAVGDGANIVVGGFGNDVITTGAGADIVLGDNGAVTYTPGTTLPALAMTTDIVNATGGNDIIATGGGDNIVLAGVGADTVTAGAGSDLVMGDNGVIAWTPTGVYDAFQTSDPTLGGNDDIRVGDGNNVVLGGFGADVIETGVGTDLILGDNGLFDFTTNAAGVAILTEAVTTDTTNATGGDDVIVSGGGAGDNIVLAGVGNDLVNVQGPNPTDPAPAVSSGQDIVIGDNGFVNWDTGAFITQFGSTDPQLGGNDQIAVGDGAEHRGGRLRRRHDHHRRGRRHRAGRRRPGRLRDHRRQLDRHRFDHQHLDDRLRRRGHDHHRGGDDIVIGGRFDDVIDAGDGDNLVIGDSAGSRPTASMRRRWRDSRSRSGSSRASRSTTAATTPSPRARQRHRRGRLRRRHHRQRRGQRHVFGDNGLIAYTDAVPTLIETTDTVAATGGDDTIDAGDGNNVVFGGVGSDTITTGSGNDVVLGDNGT